jgi:hypothetical protein
MWRSPGGPRITVAAQTGVAQLAIIDHAIDAY